MVGDSVEDDIEAPRQPAWGRFLAGPGGALSRARGQDRVAARTAGALRLASSPRISPSSGEASTSSLEKTRSPSRSRRTATLPPGSPRRRAPRRSARPRDSRPVRRARSGRAVMDLDRHAREPTLRVACPLHRQSSTPRARRRRGVRRLFVEYQESLGVDLCFQGFDRGCRELPGDYTPPPEAARGSEDGATVACVAVRRLDAATCEMKRLTSALAPRARPRPRARRDGHL